MINAYSDFCVTANLARAKSNGYVKIVPVTPANEPATYLRNGVCR